MCKDLVNDNIMNITYTIHDTIYALVTAYGKAGVSVIRISGKYAFEIAQKFCGKNFDYSKQSMKLFDIISPSDGQLIDKGLVLIFKGPNSFTGEDVVEFQLHGSIAVIKKMLKELSFFKNCRIAQPGEFSKRAFLNEKLDIVAAEGLAQLINSETEIQRRLALQQMNGQQKAFFEILRSDVIALLASIEAFIDFPDEDLPIDLLMSIKFDIDKLKTRVIKVLEEGRKSEIINAGIKVAIVGRPNVGKSSFLNLVAQRDAAIVSDIAGTTRDVIEVKLDLSGYSFVFCDTAGIHDTNDVIEKEGISRTMNAIDQSDILVIIGDPDSSFIKADHPNKIYVHNKSDLYKGNEVSSNGEDVFVVSMKTVDGVSFLIDKILQKGIDLFSLSSSGFVSNIRQKEHLENALEYLHAAKKERSIEIISEYIRLSAVEIGKIYHGVDVEDVLDVIFENFCIGK